jgi:peptidoglycan biosynthesis protein MviN/MurJ (putative lipid II flippase)
VDFTKAFSNSTRRVTFGLSIIQLFKAFLSFFTVIISSIYFGTSLGRDVWLLACSIALIFGAIIFGPVFEIFRAKFVIIKENEGEENALKSAGSLLTYMLLIAILIIILAEFIPTILSQAFAPTYNNDQQHLFIIMIRLILPTLFFSIIVSILTGILNVYRVFYVPEIMNIFSTIINVIIILLFAPLYGIYSLVLSMYLSNIVLIVVLIIVIKNKGILLLSNLNLSFKHTLDFFVFALPFYFNYLVSQIIVAAERIISTFLGIGSVSVLDYARKFVAIPISMIQSTVNIILTATLAKIFIKEGERSFILELNKFMDLILLITLPLVIIFIICPVEIVRVFLLRGAFDPKFLIPTADALFWFGFGIVSIIFFSTNAQALVAQGRTKITAFISGLLGFLILSINLVFYKKYGIQVLAFSWSAGHFVGGVIMYFMISIKEFRLLFKEFTRKIILISIVLLFCFGAYYLIFRILDIANLVFKSIVTIGIIGIFSVSVELLFVFILGFKERAIILTYIKRYLFIKRIL